MHSVDGGLHSVDRRLVTQWQWCLWLLYICRMSSILTLKTVLYKPFSLSGMWLYGPLQDTKLYHPYLIYAHENPEIEA